jgi:hypothetical protein
VGRRSRKRGTPAPEAGRAHRADRATAHGPAPRPRRRRGERPPAPWGSFPLVELCILVALVLGIVGLVRWGPEGRVMVLVAAGLGSLAGLELSVREHVAGYRSHSSLLAGTVAVIVLAVLFFSRVPREVMLPVAAAVFATAFFALRELFKRRSGGLGFRA